jgi:hypothetical protein
MPRLPWHQRNDADRDRLLSDIRKEFKESYVGPSKDKYFITASRVDQVVTRERVRKLLQPFRWYHENDLDGIRNNLRIIIAILVCSEWKDWKDFRDIFSPDRDFLGQPKYTDAMLPFRDLEFLPQAVQRDFRDNQDVFVPVVIEEDTHQIYSQDRRLPFLDDSAEVGSGFFGSVKKVVIETGQIKYSRTGDSNTQVSEERI